MAVVLLMAVPARAESERYSTPPSTKGPLVGGPLGPECVEEELWGPTGKDGRKGVCEWSYSLLPTAETDLANDYGVTWLQIDAAPPTGSCVKNIRLTFDFDGADLLSTTREGAATYKSARAVRESLKVDAGGAATSNASVFTRTVVQPGRVDVRVQEDGVRYVWRGSAAKPVSIVLGWQLRMPVTEPVYTVLSTESVLVGSC